MRTAAIIVDPQVDFCEGGNLAVEGATDAVARIRNHMLRKSTTYDLVIVTADNHVAPVGHFADPGEAPNFESTFPPHCVAGTPGQRFHPQLGAITDFYDRYDCQPTIVQKGEFEASFSGFDGCTEKGVHLAVLLRAYRIEAIDVMGLVFEFCDAATAIDGAREGFDTALLEDLTVAITPEGAAEARERMLAAGVKIGVSA